MCGIIAATSTTAVAPVLLEALRRLEYRGYDSVGIAVAAADGLAVSRSVHRIDDLAARSATDARFAGAMAGIGHTRWATHGGVSEVNAHPHADCGGELAIVHNGIIENADSLRAELERDGHRFASQVDSEVIAHLVEAGLGEGRDLLAATQLAVSRLRGSWAIAVIDSVTGRIVVAADGSPLILARSELGDFVCSDPSAVADWVHECRALDDGDVVELTGDGTWTHRGAPVSAPAAWTAPSRAGEVGLGGLEDAMQGEIAQQPEVIARILDELRSVTASGALWRDLELPAFDRIAVIGCGTSLNAGAVVAQAFGRIGGIPHQSIIASECHQRFEPGTLVLAFSQSGETADVLRAIEHVREFDLPIVAITNQEHSSIARRADAIVRCHAGPEIGVAATKTFTAQVVTGLCLAIAATAARGDVPASLSAALVDELLELPARFAASIEQATRMTPAIVASLLDAEGFLFIGRGTAVPLAEEGALKLKELTYRWAQAYPAGELKHGPLALVEAGTPVVVVDNGDPRLAGGTAEVLARGGRIIPVGGMVTGVQPWGPLEAVVPMQMLARSLAIALGHDVDKPRNLAKSVTVD